MVPSQRRDGLPDQPLISVIMPFLDAAPYLGEAVASVLVQTWARLELILVDDGGTDGTDVIARGLEALHPDRVRLVEHRGRAHLGTGPSRALGIRHVRGEFIAFLDADDVWEPSHLAAEAAMLRANPDAEFVCGRYWMWRSWSGTGEEDSLSWLAFAPGVVVAAPRLLGAVLRDGELATAPCSLMARTSAIRGVADHLQRFPSMYEDQVINAWLQMRSTAVISGDTGAWYRQHTASLSARYAARGETQDDERPVYLSWIGEQVENLRLQDPEIGRLLKLAVQEAGARPSPRRAGRGSAIFRRLAPSSFRRAARRLISPAPPRSGVVHAQRLNRLLFRYGADICGDVLQLGGPIPPDLMTCVVPELRSWTASGPGPHHELAALPTRRYDCILACEPSGPRRADPGLRHLQRALRPGGVLLLVLHQNQLAVVQEAREVFGWDAVRVDLQRAPGSRYRPLVLVRGAVPVA